MKATMRKRKKLRGILVKNAIWRGRMTKAELNFLIRHKPHLEIS